MTEEAAKPEKGRVIGSIEPTALPAELLIRNLVGYADLAGAALIIVWPRTTNDGATEPTSMSPMVSNGTSLPHLLMARAFLDHLIRVNTNFIKAPLPPTTPETSA